MTPPSGQLTDIIEFHSTEELQEKIAEFTRHYYVDNTVYYRHIDDLLYISNPTDVAEKLLVLYHTVYQEGTCTM